MAKNFKNAKLKRLYREPIKVKPVEGETGEPLKEIVEQPKVITNPMAEFFGDMHVIQQQSRDPNLQRPSFDIGGPVFQNYLLWLQLSELMKLNKKIDELLKKNA